MRYLGTAGYRARARTVMAARFQLESGLQRIGGFARLGDQPLGVTAFACPGHPSLVTTDALARRGWCTSRVAKPVGLHLTLTPVHADYIDALVADIAAEVQAPQTAVPVASHTY